MAEPMLWIADIIVGAVGESLVGEQSWLKSIESIVEVIRIGL